nr:MAG TPA: hypothetical protein [Caudoviricetes sp.]
MPRSASRSSAFIACQYCALFISPSPPLFDYTPGGAVAQWFGRSFLNIEK